MRVRNLANDKAKVSDSKKTISVFSLLSWLIAGISLIAGGIQLLLSFDTQFQDYFDWYGTHPYVEWLPCLCVVLLIVIKIVAHLTQAFRKRALSSQGNNRFTTDATISSSKLESVSPVAMTIAVVALIMSFLSFGVAHLYPEGVVSQSEMTAPFGNSDQAKSSISTRFTACKTQWLGVGQADVPGVSFGIICPSQNVLYVEFFHDNDRHQFESSLNMTGPVLMRSYASAEKNVPERKYCVISGNRWLAMVPVEDGENLHHILGGEISKLEAI